MKNFKTMLAYLTMVCMLFASCSQEEDTLPGEDPANKGTLSFGAYLNDLMDNKSALKQAMMDIPACSEDAPAFVEIVLSSGGSPVVGTVADPLRVSVNPTPQDYDGDGEEEYFTDESASLELDPGTYFLEYFTVLNADEDVIWVAPIDDDSEGNFAPFVDSALPLEIALGAGVKKYVDVEVLCFDDREVNQYGYLFFDLDTNEAFEFCFFANLCPPDGRHFPAAISVDIWIGEDNTGTQIYSDELNTVGINEDNDLFAEPLCIALPDLDEYADDEDYIYYEVTVLDWEIDGAYGDVEQAVENGTLSRNDVIANFDGEDNIDFLHLRFGCDDGGIPGEDCPGDTDCDEVPDGDDVCPGFDDSLDEDGDTIPDGCDECPGHDDREDSDGDGIPDGCDTTEECPNDDDCDGIPNEDDTCPGYDDSEDADDDGIPDGCDECPNDVGEDCDDEEYPQLEGCETAFMMGGESFFDMDFRNNRWGWAEFWNAGDGEETFEFWAAAGQNDTSRGTLVGYVTIDVDGDDVSITFDMVNDNVLQNAHIYLDGDTPTTNAPGQYTYQGDDLVWNLDVEDYVEGEGFWIIVHGDVCGEDED